MGGGWPRARRLRHNAHDPRAPLSLRHDAARRGADAGRRFRRRTTSAAIARALDRIGIDYVEGGWPGANPTDTRFFAERRRALARAKLTAFGMTKRSRPQRRQRSRPRRGARRRSRTARLPRRQELGFPRRRRRSAFRSTKTSAMIARSRSRRGVAKRARRSSMPSISSTATRPTPTTRCDCLKAARSGRGALDRAVRHQWRHAAPRGRAHRRRGGAACAAATASASTAHNDTENAVANCARRRARRRAADPGHAERAGRALRQRQSRLAHPDLVLKTLARFETGVAARRAHAI